MVKGENNRVYLNLVKWLWRLDPELAKPEIATPPPLPVPIIYTEGKTDWKHLKSAFSSLKKLAMFPELDIQFLEYGDETQMGHGELQKMCSTYCKRQNEQPNIFVFDRDVPSILNDVVEKDKSYKSWGNNVFSFAIPRPAHRADIDDVCIELYYQDKDIKRKDGKGRRLFLGDEFDSVNHKHLTLNDAYTIKPKIRRVTILDSQVYSISTGENIALPKDDFAELILNNDQNFHDVDFSEFGKIFDVMVNILRDNP